MNITREKKPRIARAAWILLTICCMLWPSVKALSEPSGDLTRTIWAAKFPEGPVKALFIAPYDAHQDTHELMQRFDLDARIVSTQTSGASHFRILTYYWPQTIRGMATQQDAVLAEVRDTVSTDWQALFIAPTPPWSAYPSDIRKLILAKAASGGVVVFCSNKADVDPDIVSSGTPMNLDTRCSEAINPVIPGAGKYEIYTYGHGTLVFLDQPNSDPHAGYLLSESPYQSEYEMSAAVLGHLIRRLTHPKVLPALASVETPPGSVTVNVAESARADL